MAGRAPAAATLVAIVMIATACDGADTRNAPVTSTSPAGTSTAPSSASASHRDEALMRVVNATSFSSNVDVFAGDLLFFDGLAFKAVTPYRAIDGKRYAFALRPAGMTRAKPLSSNTEDLKDGDYYTAFAMPGDGSDTPHLRIVNDRLDAPAAGKARLRVAHAGADAGTVRVRAGTAGAMLMDGVDYRGVTGYTDVTPIDGAVQIIGSDPAASTLATLNVHLEAGRFYTVVIVGGARAASGLEAFLIEDAPTP